MAAIDIGSNAVRLQITNAIAFERVVTFKKLEYVRFPLRLGQDVFSTNRISEFNKERFYKLMHAYKNLIDLYEVDALYACATSAMREAENGSLITRQVNEKLQLNIEIINGQKEAEMINRVIQVDLDDRPYLHIDVGGGSTELNYYKGKKRSSASFRLGSVRSLEDPHNQAERERLREWILQQKMPQKNLKAIGTGGNINKLYELSRDAGKVSRKATSDSLIRVVEKLKKMSLEERMSQLQLNPDRADVIIPASSIYLEVMATANINKIIVPDVGLKDGINMMLYEQKNPTHGKVFLRNS